MNKTFGTIAAVSLASAMLFAQSKPTFADVVVNNILSPFTVIQVGPGHRVYGPSAGWLNNPRHHQRCYRRWDPYFAEWQERCVRMHYGYGPHRGYGSYSYYD